VSNLPHPTIYDALEELRVISGELAQYNVDLYRSLNVSTAFRADRNPDTPFMRGELESFERLIGMIAAYSADMHLKLAELKAISGPNEPPSSRQSRL
jgi:hypothetical protein